jgi:RNA:NAD 2'-phosphotransferase (TPT1/KptA family)
MDNWRQYHRTTTMSRWLAYLLRYGAANHGICLWPGGWADLHQVAALRKTSAEDITSVVLMDTSNRFQILWHGGWWIRATPPEERASNRRGEWEDASNLPPLLQSVERWMTTQHAFPPPPGFEEMVPPLAYHIGAA